MIAVASLLAALAASFLAYAAWTRPFPADPTQVPTWGTGGEPRFLEGPRDALRFLDWLEEHAGRKVRINATLGPDYFSAIDRSSLVSPNESGFKAPSLDCEDVPLAEVAERYVGKVKPKCDFIVDLIIGDAELDFPCMFWLHGSWQIRGYFASEGFYDYHMGFRIYRMTPLTITEAVG